MYVVFIVENNVDVLFYGLRVSVKILVDCSET